MSAAFVAFGPVILLLKTCVNRTYSRWKIKLIYYIKTINYYNSDYKIEMYAKNYGYKVRSNNYSMCHWQKIKFLQTIIVLLCLSGVKSPKFIFLPLGLHKLNEDFDGIIMKVKQLNS